MEVSFLNSDTKTKKTLRIKIALQRQRNYAHFKLQALNYMYCGETNAARGKKGKIHTGGRLHNWININHILKWSEEVSAMALRQGPSLT